MIMIACIIVWPPIPQHELGHQIDQVQVLEAPGDSGRFQALIMLLLLLSLNAVLLSWKALRPARESTRYKSSSSTSLGMPLALASHMLNICAYKCET